VSTATILTFAAASLLLVVVPGPSVLFVIGRALAFGRRVAVLTVLGNAAGVLVLVALVAVVLGPLLQASETALFVVKLLGAAYLVVLGIRALRSHGHAQPGREPGPAPSRLRVLREGFVVGVLNPKTLVFFTAVLPQFVNASDGRVPLQLAVLGALFVAIALVCDSTWGMVAGTARSWFTADARRLARVQRGGGVILVGLGGGLTVEAVRP